MTQHRAGQTAHSEAFVIRDKFCVADQVHRVEPVNITQDATHQLAADAPSLVSGQHFQPRDEGGQHSVAEHVHEAHHTAGRIIDGYHGPEASTQHRQVLPC